MYSSSTKTLVLAFLAATTLLVNGALISPRAGVIVPKPNLAPHGGVKGASGGSGGFFKNIAVTDRFNVENPHLVGAPENSKVLTMSMMQEEGLPFVGVAHKPIDGQPFVVDIVHSDRPGYQKLFQVESNTDAGRMVFGDRSTAAATADLEAMALPAYREGMRINYNPNKAKGFTESVYPDLVPNDGALYSIMHREFGKGGKYATEVKLSTQAGSLDAFKNTPQGQAQMAMAESVGFKIKDVELTITGTRLSARVTYTKA